MHLLSFVKEYKLVLLISLILFIIPFFWLKPGEMDLGGDSSRLYFYDPISFIKSTAIYDISAQGKGIVEPNYYYLPYVAFLAILKFITASPTLVINISNGLKLAGGFIGIYLIVREMLLLAFGPNNKKIIYIVSIMSGIFYIVSSNSIHMAFHWERAIMSHNQIFLNPLMFYLSLKYLLTYKFKYLGLALIMSFIFSSNFGLTSAPPFFAFYPLAFLFLFIYVGIFGKKPISWKWVAIGGLLFLGIHAYQMLPQAVSLFDKGSFTNSKVFSKEEIEEGGVNYFVSVSTHGKAILNLLLPSVKEFFNFASLIAPLVVIVGFLLNKGKKKEVFLISFFFIITFFLVTANITHAGFEFYKRLFYIPGFSMFRVFFTQWKFIFIFFYSILLGFSLYSIFLRLKPFYSKLFLFLIFGFLILPGIPLFTGEPVNKSVIRGSNNVKTFFKIDPKYEETLKFINSLPDDGKILALPLTDSFRQVIYGKEGGAYEGPSTILHLTNKYSFVGYQNFGYGINVPYAEEIMKYTREKKYDRLLRIFTLLNIRYVFHNTDPNAYEKNFSRESSYQYMQAAMLATQKDYLEFIKHFPLTQIYKNSKYIIYEIDQSVYNSTIFVPDGIYESSQLSFDKDKSRSVFVDSKACNNLEFKSLCGGKYKKADVDVQMSMINPALYKVEIRQNEPVEDMLLVMQHSFHPGWKLVLDGKYIAEDFHMAVNGYANGWLVSGKDIPKNKNYTLFIKLEEQKYFWYGWAITTAFLMATIGLLIFSFRRIYEKS